MRDEMHLTALTLDHTDDFHRWVENKESVKYSLSAFSPSRDRDWIRDYIKSLLRNDKTWNRVIVCDRRNIGYCGLSDVSPNNRSAEFYILIGDDEYWGKGIGTKAGCEVLNYGFSQVGLHRIWLTVSSINMGAIRSYKKQGYIEEGVMREAAFRDGAFHDKIVMGILESEWYNKSMQPTAKASAD
jgi:RimJ/RimL family protein N-acetyltransferase